MTITQSDLDDMRRRAERGKIQGICLGVDVRALLDHIAQLTAERDEARREYEKIDSVATGLAMQVNNSAFRIAELEAQSSAQFVAGMREALRKLSNEVLGCASAFEPELRQYLSHTNFNILVHRAEEARAILAEAALKGGGK